MNKLIKLLTLGTVLPLSLNSLNLISVCYSSDNSLSTGVTIDKQALEIENTARRYCNSLNANLENLYKTGGTMGCLYNGGNLTEASKLAADLLQGGNISAKVGKESEESFNTGDKATVAILIDVVSKGLRWDFSNGVDDMIGALTKYIEAKGDEKKLSSPKEYEEYCKGRNYLATAVFQEMLIKLCRTSSALFDEDDFIECCRIVENYLNVQVGNKKVGAVVSQNWKNLKIYSPSKRIREMVRDTITATIGGFYSIKGDLDAPIDEDDRLNIDLSKRIKYKKYFRDCTYQGIKKYFGENKNVKTIKSATLADIEKWKQNEENMYDLINELKEERKKDAQIFNDYIKPNFEKCVSTKDTSIDVINDVKMRYMSEKHFNQIKEYIDATRCHYNELASMLPKSGGELQTPWTRDAVKKKLVFYGEKSLSELVDKIEHTDNKDTERVKRMKKWVNNPLIKGSKLYQKIINDMIGKHSEDIFINISGLYVLNEFNKFRIKDIEGMSSLDPRLKYSIDTDKSLDSWIIKYNERLTSNDYYNWDNVDEELAKSLLSNASKSKRSSAESSQIWNIKDKSFNFVGEIGDKLLIPKEILSTNVLNSTIKMPDWKDYCDEEILSENEITYIRVKVEDVKLSVLISVLSNLRCDLIKAGNLASKDDASADQEYYQSLLSQYKVLASVYSWCLRNGVPVAKKITKKIKRASSKTENMMFGKAFSVIGNDTVGDVIDIIKQDVLVSSCVNGSRSNTLKDDYDLPNYYKDLEILKGGTTIEENEDLDYEYNYDLPKGYGAGKLSDKFNIAIRTLRPLIFSLKGGVRNLSLKSAWELCSSYKQPSKLSEVIPNWECENTYWTHNILEKLQNDKNLPINGVYKQTNLSEPSYYVFSKNISQLFEVLNPNQDRFKICSIAINPQEEHNKDAILIYEKKHSGK